VLLVSQTLPKVLSSKLQEFSSDRWSDDFCNRVQEREELTNMVPTGMSLLVSGLDY